MMTSDELEDSPGLPGLLAYEREPVHLPLGVTVENLVKVQIDIFLDYSRYSK